MLFMFYKILCSENCHYSKTFQNSYIDQHLISSFLLLHFSVLDSGGLSKLEVPKASRDHVGLTCTI